MSAKTSRHAGLATYAVERAGRPTVELYEPRFAPPIEAQVLHRVVAGDRLDLLAARYFGDPLQYWRIVDANPVDVPDALLEPGRFLRIPDMPR